ncbi:MAG: hypothetical protein JXR87_10355 [Candidatus Marinimicrobia bacterium]|nr:hypothetical protein [Candidatus Neomarinimicrobiota bacterium]
MIRFIAMISEKTGNLLLVTIVLVLFSQLTASELSTDPKKVLEFADHLFKTEDFLRAAIEYERFLFLSNSDNDTILFKIGLCHQFRERYDYAGQSFSRIIAQDDSKLVSTARIALLYNHYKLQDWVAIQEFAYENDTEFYYYYLASLYRDSISVNINGFNNITDDSLRSALMDIEQRRSHIRRKSPVFSSILSAIVPGLGKTNIRRPGDALFSFGMTSFAGLVTWQAFKANLLITGIVSSGITLSFYLGTIYGTYVGTILYNESLNDKLIEKLEQYNPVLKNPYWQSWQKK